MERVLGGNAHPGSNPELLQSPVLLEQLRHEIDEHPCPECGWLQPEMVNRRGALAHGILLVATLALALAGGMYRTSVHAVPFLLAPILVVIALAHLLASRQARNRGRAPNVALAAEEVQAGVLKLDRAGDLSARHQRPALLPAFLLVLGGVAPLLVPLAAAVLSWPVNENLVPIAEEWDEIRSELM